MKLPPTESNVSNLADHPSQVRQRIASAVARQCVSYDIRLNDVQPPVLIREILETLRAGTIQPGSIRSGGRYLRAMMELSYAGRQIVISIFLHDQNGTEHLHVHDASALDEED